MRTPGLVSLITLGSLLASAPPARAQVPMRVAPIPIAAALDSENTFRPVTIAGRATVRTGKLQVNVFDIAVQDATAGVRVFSRSRRLAQVEAGDSVVATGLVKRYRGDVELVASSVRVVPGPRRAVTPVTLPLDTAQLAPRRGQLVRVSGRVVRAGVSEGGQWARLAGPTPEEGVVTLWASAGHSVPTGLAGTQPNDSLEATGIVTSFQDNIDDPVAWQVVPRDSADVVVAHRPFHLPTGLARAVLAALAVVALAMVLGRFTAKRQLASLRETEARYRQLLELSPEAVIVHAGGSILFANPAAAQLLGAPSAPSLVGRPLEEHVHPESRALLTGPACLSDGSASPRTLRHRARFVGAHDAVVDVEVTSSPCVYHDRPATVLLARDISAQLRYERDLHALALVDDLTGLQNRRGFTLFAEQELARARRHGWRPVVVFADLDRLKQINDLHGHAAGDDALRLMARAFKSILRESDIVARWSGDEFVALMDDGGAAAIASIGDRLDAALAALAPKGQPYQVTASVGTSILDPALPLATAMERADARLYADKNRDRRQTPRGWIAQQVDSSGDER